MLVKYFCSLNAKIIAPSVTSQTKAIVNVGSTVSIHVRYCDTMFD